MTFQKGLRQLPAQPLQNVPAIPQNLPVALHDERRCTWLETRACELLQLRNWHVEDVVATGGKCYHVPVRNASPTASVQYRRHQRPVS